ncbi:MAG TPA: hypothetical protein VMU05_20360 [Dongiaceae bacterium]|nr:hypothetical protein [Dongiaceae bacterium]
MVRAIFVFASLFVLQPTAQAQRHGRPDGLQLGYAHDSTLLLEVQRDKKRYYFGEPDLTKMTRHSISAADPLDGRMHAFEGVDLQELTRKTGGLPFLGSIEVSFGKRQKFSLPSGSNLIVLDVMDRNKIHGHVPYYLVARMPGRSDLLLKEVTCITIFP